MNNATPKVKFATKNRTTILPTPQAHLLNDIFAVFLFAISLVLAGMLLTYSPSDVSWFKTATSDTLHNQFGVIGADVADIIFSLFGRSGIWLILGLFYLGFRKIIRVKIHTGSWYTIFQIFNFCILLLSSTIFEYMILYNTPTIFFHDGNGGIIGHVLYDYIALKSGPIFINIAVLVLLITSFCFTFSLSLLTVAETIGYLVELLYNGLINLFKSKSKSITNDHSSVNVSTLADSLIVPSALNTTTSNVNITPELDWNDQQPTLEETVDKSMHVDNTIVKSVFSTAEKNKNKLKNLLPNTDVLTSPKLQIENISQETLEFISISIEGKLAEFGVEAKIINAEIGPVITRYELLPSRGVRGDKIVGLSKEIARGLALTNVRIVETIPGKNSMGIEVPNFKRKIIYLKEIFDSVIYKRGVSKLTLALGKDISGNVIVTDLAKMPHLLVAGTTGSGKSVAVNAMILSILFQATPDEVKFIMIDPKMVELSFYQDIPHLLAPVVTDMTQAANALKWTVGEMERRYKIMAAVGCKTIVAFNQKIKDHQTSGNPIANPFCFGEEIELLQPWPYIVVIIDELADLMMVTGKKIEQYIARIAQKARAIGIHLIVATQRPSVDVITGLIKANIPARISFQVSSKIDSRTILDQMGAETLLGQGDMLFLQPGNGYPQRIHGAFVNDDELNKVVEFLKTTAQPEYIEDILLGDTQGAELPGLEDNNASADLEKDAIFDEVVKFIDQTKRCSISSLQTRFGVGYNRAARIMAHLEDIGMVTRNQRGGFELIRK